MTERIRVMNFFTDQPREVTMSEAMNTTGNDHARPSFLDALDVFTCRHCEEEWLMSECHPAYDDVCILCVSEFEEEGRRRTRERRMRRAESGYAQ